MIQNRDPGDEHHEKDTENSSDTTGLGLVLIHELEKIAHKIQEIIRNLKK